MRLDQAMNRIGAEIVKEEKTEEGITLFVRAPQDAVNGPRWTETIKEFLIAAEQNKGQSWSADVSKTFFAKDGAVRFLWRFILGGSVASAAGALGRAAIRALASGVEVKSMPLVGRREYEFDVSRGKMMGGHPMGEAAGILATALKGS